MSRSRAARSSPDAVSELVKLLAEEREFTSIEIAETLWLAMQIEPVIEISDQAGVEQSQSAEVIAEQSQTSPATEVEEAPELPPPPPPLPKANITASIPQAGVLPPQTLPVWLADPAMLTDSLAVIRALKPLLQKAEAGIGKRLNEPATVDNIARTRLCLPVLEPEQEPWFDIVLVVDRGSSMHIWQRLVKDVTRILRRYGAFRDVQVFDLIVNQADQPSKNSKAGDAVRLVAKPQHPGHRPSELIDQRGRRIVIVLSDCAGAYWWDGTLLPMLQEWGKIMPTVIWQMLPAWMWKRTALGRGTVVAISNDIPGVANQRLKTRIQERDEPEDADQRIPVPIVTSEVRDLARWSLMVAGDRQEITPGFLLPQQGGSIPRSKSMEELAHERAQRILNEGSDLDPDTAFSTALETLARERVNRFLELASPQAQRLIMLLAAAPVITMPVVRLIRDAMLYEAQSPLPVAEVFLSGLLLRLPGQEDSLLERVLQEERDRAEREQVATSDQPDLTLREEELDTVPLERQDLVQYDFAPQVRNVLLKVLPEVDTIEVINSVSAAVEQRWNRFSDQDFRAFLTNPRVQAPEGLEGLRSFASVTAEILEQLGGEYVGFARQLRQGRDGVSPHEPETEDEPTRTESSSEILKSSSHSVIDEIVDAIREFSQTRTGSLLLIETDRPVDERDFAVPGVRLNAEVSKELLQTIFQTSTLLHDGAVFIRGSRIVSAGVILPISDRTASRQMGTRHRAAMGITERVENCLCIVVSEETGSISFAEKGTLNRPLTSSKLRGLLRERFPPSIEPTTNLAQQFRARTATFASSIAQLFRPQKSIPVPNSVIEEIVDAVKELSQNRTGALLILETDRPVDERDFSVPGVRLNAEVSKELLQTIFQTSTLLHDGAVFIRGSRIVSAGVFWTISEWAASLQTDIRHQNAMGITTRVKNCLCIVVSEETGAISFAERGNLNRPLTSSKLRELLRERFAPSD